VDAARNMAGRNLPDPQPIQIREFTDSDVSIRYTPMNERLAARSSMSPGCTRSGAMLDAPSSCLRKVLCIELYLSGKNHCESFDDLEQQTSKLATY
jgi:hypothetical protein